MKKTKFNPELLKEELNRFKSINEYSFGMRERNLDDDDLILGNSPYLDEADEDPEAAGDAIAKDLGVPPPGEEAAAPADFGGDAQAGDAALPPAEPNPANAEEVPAPEPPMEPTPAAPEVPMEEPAGDEVELDVTDLVDSTDEAKSAADKASHNTKLLMKKLEDLESRIASMDAVSGKIDALEKEIVKRNPTNVEKLEMQSLHSGPYTQKLTDYWADKHGAYDVMGNDKKEEYVLDKDTVDYDYSENDIKQSFAVKPDEYEEEDI
jgi:hypothetical protein